MEVPKNVDVSKALDTVFEPSCSTELACAVTQAADSIAAFDGQPVDGNYSATESRYALLAQECLRRIDDPITDAWSAAEKKRHEKWYQELRVKTALLYDKVEVTPTIEDLKAASAAGDFAVSIRDRSTTAAHEAFEAAQKASLAKAAAKPEAATDAADVGGVMKTTDDGYNSRQAIFHNIDEAAKCFEQIVKHYRAGVPIFSRAGLDKVDLLRVKMECEDIATAACHLAKNAKMDLQDRVDDDKAEAAKKAKAAQKLPEATDQAEVTKLLQDADVIRYLFLIAKTWQLWFWLTGHHNDSIPAIKRLKELAGIDELAALESACNKLDSRVNVALGMDQSVHAFVEGLETAGKLAEGMSLQSA